MDVETSVGKFVLRRPNAGERNKVLIKTSNKGEVNEFEFMIELLPVCVVSHPLGVSKPLKGAIEELSVEDYDLVMRAFAELNKTSVDIKK